MNLVEELRELHKGFRHDQIILLIMYKTKLIVQKIGTTDPEYITKVFNEFLDIYCDLLSIDKKDIEPHVKIADKLYGESRGYLREIHRLSCNECRDKSQQLH